MPSWKPNCLKGVDQNDNLIIASSHNLLNNNNKNITISSPIPITTPATPSPSIKFQNTGILKTNSREPNIQKIIFYLI